MGGRATLGSAITTIGSSVFLLFCSMSIFKKLGGIVIGVSLMAVVAAIGPLAALLLLLGPVEPGRRCGWPTPSELERSLKEGVNQMQVGEAIRANTTAVKSS